MIEEIINNARVSANGRKLYTAEQKSYIVDAWESGSLSAPEFCRRYGILATALYRWRKDAKRGSIMGIKNEGELHSKAELDALRKENEELKKALGEAILDLKIIKKNIALSEQRKRIS